MFLVIVNIWIKMSWIIFHHFSTYYQYISVLVVIQINHHIGYVLASQYVKQNISKYQVAFVSW